MAKRASNHSDLDIESLTRLFDQTKSELYARPYAAFYGSVLCAHNFFWAPDIGTAAIDGVNLMWNPYWFLHLNPKSRVTVLMHEIKHPSGLHFARMGERIPLIWNYACDIKINNQLKSDGYSFEQLEWSWMDSSFSLDAVEEDIYDELIRRGQGPSMGCWGQTPGEDALGQPSGTHEPSEFPDDGTDMFPSGGPMTQEEQAAAINNVIRAQQQAVMSGADGMPGDIDKMIKQFLAPVVPWELFVHRWMQELTEGGYTWRRPNRRYQTIYLPSRYEDVGAMDHLIYYEDVSGSITDKDSLRFNSEFKYVKEHYKPKKMTLVQFDMIIQQEVTYEEEDPFDQVELRGGGGTSLECVREHILKHKPTCAVVFSDMQCAPMASLGFEIPILWVCISNKSATVPFGQIIHIR
jgi:predicted metal-dependent peptidase